MLMENSLDQPMVLTPADKKIFDEVDMIIGRSITAGDPIIALEYGKGLLLTAQVQGLALAKLLFRLRENWNIFEVAGCGDTLEAMAVVYMGRSAQTITKYIRLWENLFANETIPQDIRNQLMGRPVKDLLLLTALAREGTDEETLKRIVAAPDHNSVRDIVRGERGTQRGGINAIHIFVDMRRGHSDCGVLTIKHKGGIAVIGTLDVENDDPAIQKAIARIVQAAGIVERFE